MTLVTAYSPLLFLNICLLSCIGETMERNVEHPDTPIEGRIVGGEDAKPGQFPFQAQFRFTDVHECGAVIIDKDSLLTAGHCLIGRDQELMMIWAGRIKTNGLYVLSEINYVKIVSTQLCQPDPRNVSDPQEQGRSVLSYVYHEYYTDRGVKGDLNDLAIITVNQSFEFNDFVKPVKLPLSTHPVPARGFVSGWGTTRPDGTVPPLQLQYIEMNTISNEECQRRMVEEDIQDQHLCIFSNGTPNKSVCIGDSGSGFVDKDGKLFGIVSFISDDCSGAKPQGLMRITHPEFLYWIDNHNRTCS